MMDFARRLTPLRESDPTRAIAVLPSRFAGESPLRASIAAPAQRDDSAAPLRPAPMPASDAAALRSDASAHHAGDVTRLRAFSSSPVVASETDVARPEAVAPTVSAAAAVALASSATSRAQPSVTSPLERLLPASKSVAMASVAAASGSRVVPPIDAGAPAFGAPRFEPLQGATRQPISGAAIASRGPVVKEARPIVHVTIDRIEVRAAAASARAVPTARARVPSASPSLGEYLRRRNGKAGGDA